MVNKAAGAASRHARNIHAALAKNEAELERIENRHEMRAFV